MPYLLLDLWIRIPPRAWMYVCIACWVLSGRGLCDGLITRPEKSYQLWCVFVCDLETSRMRRPWPALGRRATRKNNLPLDSQIAVYSPNSTTAFYIPLFLFVAFKIICCLFPLSRILPPQFKTAQITWACTKFKVCVVFMNRISQFLVTLNWLYDVIILKIRTKIPVFYDVTLYRLVNSFLSFEGT